MSHPIALIPPINGMLIVHAVIIIGTAAADSRKILLTVIHKIRYAVYHYAEDGKRTYRIIFRVDDLTTYHDCQWTGKPTRRDVAAYLSKHLSRPSTAITVISIKEVTPNEGL